MLFKGIFLALAICNIATSNGERGVALLLAACPGCVRMQTTAPKISAHTNIFIKQNRYLPTQTFFFFNRIVMSPEDTVSNNDKEDEVHDGQR